MLTVPKCDDGWICEAHPEFPWPHRVTGAVEDCPGPGMLCHCEAAFPKHDLEECVKRLHMEPGDVVVVKLKKQPTDNSEVKYIQSMMEAIVPGHHILVHGPDVGIEVLGEL